MRSKQHRAADSSVARSNKHCQTIIGSTMLPPQTLADLDGTPGNFFVFHDLSIRVQGFYTLKCELLELDSSGPFPRFRSLHTIFTSPIHMFPPKFFPGMLESTPLSKCFAKQGMPIHIRRDYACLQSERDIAIPAVSHTNVVHDSA
nr:hypothetical protein HK105_000418 [Polyrhizophydium stewartii]